MRTPLTPWYVAGIAAMVLLIDGSSTSATEKTMGKIKKFECGDNCYISIVDELNNEMPFLCYTSECKSWLEKGGIPEDRRGLLVEVEFRSDGKQVDGNGDLVSAFAEVVNMRFVSAKEAFDRELSRNSTSTKISISEGLSVFLNKKETDEATKELREIETKQQAARAVIAVFIFILCAIIFKYRVNIYKIFESTIVLFIFLMKKSCIEIREFNRRISVRVDEKIAANKAKD